MNSISASANIQSISDLLAAARIRNGFDSKGSKTAPISKTSFTEALSQTAAIFSPAKAAGNINAQNVRPAVFPIVNREESAGARRTLGARIDVMV